MGALVLATLGGGTAALSLRAAWAAGRAGDEDSAAGHCYVALAALLAAFSPVWLP